MALGYSIKKVYAWLGAMIASELLIWMGTSEGFYSIHYLMMEHFQLEAFLILEAPLLVGIILFVLALAMGKPSLILLVSITSFAFCLWLPLFTVLNSLMFILPIITIIPFIICAIFFLISWITLKRNLKQVEEWNKS